jgi:hypothetical protein
MKCKLLAIATVTIASLNFLSANFAQAAPQRIDVVDRESNDTASTPQRIGTLHFEHVYTIKGNLRNNQDRTDNYSFNIGRKAQYIATLVSPNQQNAEMRLYRNDTLVANFKSGVAIDRLLDAGDYRLEVTAPAAAAPFEYVIPLVTPVAPPLRLTITNAKALSKFDDRAISLGTDRADFRIKPTIDGRAMDSKKIAEDDTPAFNHTVTYQPNATQFSIPISLRLTEEDPGSDETADISPDPNQKDLQPQYAVRTGEVFGPNGLRGRLGETLTVAGTNDKKASITFRID